MRRWRAAKRPCTHCKLKNFKRCWTTFQKVKFMTNASTMTVITTFYRPTEQFLRVRETTKIQTRTQMTQNKKTKLGRLLPKRNMSTWLCAQVIWKGALECSLSRGQKIMILSWWSSSVLKATSLKLVTKGLIETMKLQVNRSINFT